MHLAPTHNEHADQAALAGFAAIAAAFVVGFPTALVLTVGWQVTGLFYFACFTALCALVYLDEVWAR